MSDAAGLARLSAWQRWEIASLASAAAAPKPSAAEVDAARAAGFAEGRLEGRAEGYQAGIAAAEVDTARLAALVARLGETASDHEQRIADELLDFALALAQQMVATAIDVRRDLLLPVVAAALKQLPQATQRTDIVLNPADVELVRTFLASDPGAGRVHLVADPGEAIGGCRIETAEAAIDASVGTRWKRTVATLGRNDEWLGQR